MTRERNKRDTSRKVRSQSIFFRVGLWDVIFRLIIEKSAVILMVFPLYVTCRGNDPILKRLIMQPGKSYIKQGHS